jgi:hypothetical protein
MSVTGTLGRPPYWYLFLLLMVRIEFQTGATALVGGTSRSEEERKRVELLAGTSVVKPPWKTVRSTAEDWCPGGACASPSCICQLQPLVLPQLMQR